MTVAPATASVNTGATHQFTSTAKDANGNDVAGVNFLWISSNHNVATVDQSGLATGVAGGSATISASGHGEPGSATLAVNASAATQLAFSVQPTVTTPGEAISPAVQVEIRDADGALVTSARDAVTLSVGTNPGPGFLLGTITVNAVGGIATFGGLSIDEPGIGYTLVASSGALTDATSNLFDINDVRRKGDIVFYKNYDAWFGENKHELALAGHPFNFVAETDYFVRPVADLISGIPEETSLIILTSASQDASPILEQNDPAAVANLESWVFDGGWLAVDAGDNNAGGYIVPGLAGIADDIAQCPGLTLEGVDNAFVRGPDAELGTADDLTDVNVDMVGSCSVNHGSLDGILPANATVLLVEEGGGNAQCTQRIGMDLVV